ncbi:MAG: cbb3-type cytochrome c oxidase subunit 3 [Balneolaceae bacterium]|nr:cbb3-type cytochrome c oxidase subunit 3 [Balneolaceae bacterium]
MYKEVLRSIEGIGIFPSIALVIFLAFFVGLIIYLIKKGRAYFQDVARLPLEDPDDTNNNNKYEES